MTKIKKAIADEVKEFLADYVVDDVRNIEVDNVLGIIINSPHFKEEFKNFEIIKDLEKQFKPLEEVLSKYGYEMESWKSRGKSFKSGRQEFRIHPTYHIRFNLDGSMNLNPYVIQINFELDEDFNAMQLNFGACLGFEDFLRKL